MKSLTISNNFLFLVVFFLVCVSVYAQNGGNLPGSEFGGGDGNEGGSSREDDDKSPSDPGGVDINGANVQGDGISVGKDGSVSFDSGSGTVGGHSVSGNLAGSISQNGNTFSGTTGNGASIAGTNIGSGMSFSLDLGTGELSVTAPKNGGYVSTKGNNIDLAGGATATFSSDGSVSISEGQYSDKSGNKANGKDISVSPGGTISIGEGSITNNEGYVGSGTKFSYDPSTQVYSGPFSMTVTSSDGKKSVTGSVPGHSITVSVAPMDKKTAEKFVLETKNSAVLNPTYGRRAMVHRGYVEGTMVTEKSTGKIPESSAGIRENVIVEWTKNDKFISCNDCEVGRITLDKYGIIAVGKPGTIYGATVLKKEESGYGTQISTLELEFIGSSLTPATQEFLNGLSAEESKKIQEDFINEAKKNFDINERSIHYTSDFGKNIRNDIHITTLEKPGFFLDGKLFDALEEYISEPVPEISLKDPRIEVRNGVKTAVFSVDVITHNFGKIKTNVEFAITLDQLKSYKGKSIRETLTNILTKENIDIGVNTEHELSSLASYSIIEKIQALFTVAGVTPNRPYHEKTMKTINDKVVDGKVSISVNTGKSTVTISENEEDTNPVTIEMDSFVVDGVRERYVEPSLPEIISNTPPEWAEKIRELQQE